MPEGASLSIAQVKLLFHLPAEGTLGMSRWAEAAGMTPASLSQALEALERAGVVERTRSERDRRVVEVGITPAGHELLGRVRSFFEQRWDRCIATIPPAELEVATRVLGRVLDLFDPSED
jgi:DNA-binding MarR family transcriptional regulator